jgi:hypothetical protein
VIRIVLFLPCNGAAPKRRRDTCPSLFPAGPGIALETSAVEPVSEART